MADKLINQLTASASDLQDVDLLEGQLNGDAFSRKLTGLQIRQVEKTARETADNVIEAGAGLNANGTFTPPANSWYMRVADFAAGCTDRGGATGALTENILNGLRLLDARITLAGTGNVVVSFAAIAADTTFAAVLPAGFMLQYVILEEKAGNAGVLDLGTTAGGSQVFINLAVPASELTTAVLPKIYSLGADTTFYLNDDDASSSWNGAVVDIYFVMTQIL